MSIITQSQRLKYLPKIGYICSILILIGGCGQTSPTENRDEEISQTSATTPASVESPTIDSAINQPTGTTQNFQPPSVASPLEPESRAAASRFLAQSTFGPTQASINEVLQLGYADWITQQMELPANSMLTAFDMAQSANSGSAPSRDWIFESFWRHAVEGDDQLRQRMAFALSQIFVISLRDGAVASHPRGVADFYSMLGRHAFGNFRSLLEDVTLHPMMGAYLSHLGNQKGDPSTGRVPDENFAREIMQLFTIGLYQLNTDGSLNLDEQQQPQETYTTEDVQGLAKVFTGFSWGGPDKSLGRFQGWIPEPGREILPMQSYPAFHSTAEKRFLGTVIESSDSSTPEEDLQIALDALFNHPNTGPFISRQLIQRLVTSNPDKRFTERVALVFNDNGSGVRGDMAAVVRAILLDPHARDLGRISNATQGRVREPLLRMTHWLRSFKARSATGQYELLGTDDPATSLGMTVLRSPSVFNFFRPGYTPPNTPIADAGLVAPEMQLTHETSVAGYLNVMLNAVYLGTGSGNQITSDFADEITIADDPQALVEHINLLLHHGSMSTTLKGWISEAITSIALPERDAQARKSALLERARIATYLALASPEYIVLK